MTTKDFKMYLTIACVFELGFTGLCVENADKAPVYFILASVIFTILMCVFVFGLIMLYNEGKK